MNTVGKIIVFLSRFLDRLSGLTIIAIMLLVVSNILLRTFFSVPILGTFEFVSFMTAMAISLSLANCAVENGHIAVDLFFNMFPRKVQRFLVVVTGIMSAFFLGLFSWRMGIFATRLMVSGEVSATTRLPFYIFAYITMIGLMLLALVVLLKSFEDPQQQHQA